MTWHALARCGTREAPRTALVTSDAMFDLATVGRQWAPHAHFLSEPVATLLGQWGEAAPLLADLAERLVLQKGAIAPLPADQLLLAPFEPQRIFGAASNFIEHAQEMGTVLAAKADSMPYMFMKAETSVVGPYDDIILPTWAKQVDWEVELTAVIGQGGRDIAVERALDHVAAYTVMNDVSARDLGRRNDFPFKQDWFRQKSFDTFGPMGPWLVPAGLMSDPQAIGLRLSVNDDLMQNGTTAEMIFTVAEQIAYLSRIVTLKPGDVIMTGTPDGVGMARGIFLKAGDVVSATVDGIGTIRNAVRGAA